jgi:hypothetical protein
MQAQCSRQPLRSVERRTEAGKCNGQPLVRERFGIEYGAQPLVRRARIPTLSVVKRCRSEIASRIEFYVCNAEVKLVRACCPRSG